jgi:hypothetical protein
VPGVGGIVEGRRRIRPALWLIGSTLGILVGAGMGATSVAAATAIGETTDAPACEIDFAGDCVTERSAVLDSEGYTRGAWLTREQKWFAAVPQGAPDLVPGERLALHIPRQAGRDELERGRAVTVLYLGRAPAWVRLPSGAVLETDDHPRRAAPMWGWFALFALAGGVFGLRTAVRSGRRGGVWWRPTPMHRVFGVSSALATAGLFGSLGQILAGGTAWPGIIAGALGLALGTAGAIRARRRALAGAVVPPTDLERYG